MKRNDRVLFLFDVDGVLCRSREKVGKEMLRMLEELRKRVVIGFVSGSDLEKQKEQIGSNVLELFDYGFPENGTIFYRHEELVSTSSIVDYLTEDRYKKVLRIILRSLSDVECPVKRGNFVELRNGMINVSPIGRRCSKEERREFHLFDRKHGVRNRLCLDWKEDLKEYGLECSIGGEISIDIFPDGWDKSYCLRHIQEATIVFFGDMVEKGGNDYEVFHHPRVNGIRCNGCEETMNRVIEELERLGIDRIVF
jgi:phosphomannomutase